MSSPSISKASLVLEVGGGPEIRVELKRHLAPRTVGALLRSLPLSGNAHLLGRSIVYVEAAIDSGAERPRRDFRKGDVAFYSAGQSVCFFIGDASPGMQMSPIGKVVSGIDGLAGASAGDVVSIRHEAG